MSPSSARSVAEHRALVAGLLDRLPVADLPLAESLGLVLARDLVAPIALPPFDNSAMDGYAVRAAELAGASAERPLRLPVAEDIPAGRTDVPALAPGTVHRIMTGAPLPAGADAVIQVELTDGGVTEVELRAEVEPGLHLRRRGEDVAAGSVVLTAGTELSYPRLGLAAAVGAATLPVHRRPLVLILSTGSELVAPGRPLAPGQIYESNAIMLASAVREIGGIARTLNFVPDDVTAFRAALEPELAGADLLITSGGVSAGAYEVVKDALTGHGVEFAKVAMQPGGPQGAGRYAGVPVVTLPGNPVSSAISFEVFVRPALLAAMGHIRTDRVSVTGTLTTALTAPAHRRQYRRGSYDPATGAVGPVGGPGSHLMNALARSNCLFVVPEEVTEIAAGSAVEVLLLPPG
jgi:molybdopterin molybdotransferase